MKILFTLDFPPERGGIQRYLHDIVVHTFTSADRVYTGVAPSEAVRTDRKKYPCDVIRVGAPFAALNKKVLLFPLLNCLIRELIRNGPRLTAVAGNIYPGLVMWLVSLFVPLRYELYCYGTELLPLKRRFSLRCRLFRAALRRAATVYYLTGATRELCELSGRSGPYVKAAPRIDVPVCPARSAHGAGPLSLLAVGRLVPHKGHQVLIDAAAGLSGVAGWKCIIAGSGPEHDRLTARIERHQLDNVIAIEPDLPDERLAELYRNADLLIHPSLAASTGIEGFGIVLLEAMAYGATIIASRSGGIEEVVDNNPSIALLVPPGDPAALRSAMTRLMTDHRLRLNMSRAARKFCRERYAWK